MDATQPAPPHSIEAEQAVLGGLMLVPEALAGIAGKLDETDFYRSEHRLIFRAIAELVRACTPCDAVTLGEWFERHGETASIGGAAYLAELANNTPSAANITAYADIVREHAQRRRVADFSARLATFAADPSKASDELLAGAAAELGKLAGRATATKRRRLLFRDAAVPPPLDFVLPGLLRGTAGLLVGQGAIGKSFLALQIGIGIALGQPIAQGPAGDGLFPAPTRGAVAIVAGEDPEDELLRRMHAARAALHQDEIEILDGDHGLHIESGLGQDLRIVQSDSRGLAQGPWLPQLRELATGRRLVILDPLAFLHDAEEIDNGAMTFLMRTIARVGVEKNCAFLVLHHVRKPSGNEQPDDWARARGASALTTCARMQLDMRGVSEAEATKFGIDESMRGYWVRVATVKLNYGPPSEPVFMSRTGAGGLLRRADPTLTPSEKAHGWRDRC